MLSVTALALSVSFSAHANPAAQPPAATSEVVQPDSASLLRQGWMQYWARDHVAARPYAVAVLEQDRDALGAHWLYLKSWSSNTEALVQQYRSWHEAAPDDPVRSVVLAASLLANARDGGDWCDEASTLLEVSLEPPSQALWLHKIRFKVHRMCDQDTSADLAAIAILAEDTPEAAQYLIHVRILSGQIDAALVEQIRTQTALDPWALNDATVLWWQSIEDSWWTRKAKRAAIEGAKATRTSEDIIDVYSAWRLLDWADDPMAADIRPQLDAHLGIGAGEEDGAAAKGSVSREDLYEADKSPTNEDALARLDALSERVPEHGLHRATLEGLRGSRLSNLGRHEEALVSFRRAWEEDPSAYSANRFAWEATIAEQELELALEAITSAIAEFLPKSHADAPVWRNYTSWREWYARKGAQYLDTRGWLLFKLGRVDEATADLQQSIIMKEMEENHHHLATVLLDQGQPAAAFESLVQAALVSDGDPSDVVYADLQAGYPGGGIWHPDGLDGYIEFRMSIEDDAEEAEEEHALLGEPFPFTSYTNLRGRQQPLEVGGDILVVDFWATWCGPCIQGMPHLQEVAAAYADQGVRIIGLSVDDELDLAQAFFSGDFQPAYTVGWVGFEGFETGAFRGIPSLFVVDQEGRIDSYIAGYGTGDTRLEDALDALLAESP